MRRLVIYLVLFVLLLPAACSRKTAGTTINVVKPKYHHRWYDRKKDRHTSRTKRVKVRN